MYMCMCVCVHYVIFVCACVWYMCACVWHICVWCLCVHVGDVCVHVCDVCAHMYSECIWQSEDNFLQSILVFHLFRERFALFLPIAYSRPTGSEPPVIFLSPSVTSWMVAETPDRYVGDGTQAIRPRTGSIFTYRASVLAPVLFFETVLLYSSGWSQAHENSPAMINFQVMGL